MCPHPPALRPPGVAVLAALAAGSFAAVASASLTPSWITEGNRVLALYGRSVASAGDVNGDGYADVIVGAPLYQNPGGQGRVFVIHGSPSGLLSAPAWTAEGTTASQGFGHCVAGAGDVNGDGYADVVVGRAYGDAGGQAWVYHGSSAGLGTSANRSAVGPPGFGIIVAGAGDVNGGGFSDMVVGRDGAWIYHGSASGLSLTPDLELTATFVRRVAAAGDVNGDGFDDVLVGLANPTTFYGASLHLGSASGLSPTSSWTGYGDQVGAEYGSSVAGAGDVNLDGFDDILVGEPLFANGQPTEGRVYLYYGSAGAPDTSPDWTAEGNQAGALFGSVVAGAGDIDGDGHADLLIGSPAYDNGQLDEGRVFVYFGSALGPSLTPDWTAESDQADSKFASSAAGAGDVDNDGGAGIIVGAYQFQNPEDFEGRSYVYQTALVGVPPRPEATIPSLSLAPPTANPSPGGFELRFVLPAAGRARLTVQDVAGRTVAVLCDGVESAGPHVVLWDGGGRAEHMPSGVYVARLEFAGRVEQRKLVLAR